MSPVQAGSALGDGAAAARFRSALAAKEDVEHRLETELAAARAQAASYEHRCDRGPAPLAIMPEGCRCMLLLSRWEKTSVQAMFAVKLRESHAKSWSIGKPAMVCGPCLPAPCLSIHVPRTHNMCVLLF